MSDLTPITRTENFLARIAGDDAPELEPITRIEHFLQNIVDVNAGGGLSTDTKYALIACFEKVAWVDEHGQDYVDALRSALFPPTSLDSISAVYTQSGTVYNTDTLDSLKDDLVVTATYEDSNTEVVKAYTLSGTLTVGTSTITVSYGGKTDTFNVIVKLDQATIFGTFEAGAIAKGTSAYITQQYKKLWKSDAAARIRMSVPVVNNGYTITVTDNSKYAVAAYDPVSLTEYSVPVSGGYIQGYQGGEKTVTWVASDSVTTEYIWVAFKKNDDTEFTDTELAHGAEAVFTFTTA